MTIHDWHVAMMHLLGLDHQRLPYDHDRRGFRLNDVRWTAIEDAIG